MMQTVSVWVGAEITYLYGTVNGMAATFTLVGSGHWQAIVPRSTDGNYAIYLEAYSDQGLEGTYTYTIYYGMLPLITDRTIADIYYRTDKGFYNVTDLNRVGAAVKYIADTLNTYGYNVKVEPRVDWRHSDTLKLADLEKYLADVRIIKEAFYGTQVLPDNMQYFTFEDANNIEKLLEEVYRNVKQMIASLRYCGMFTCGASRALP